MASIDEVKHEVAMANRALSNLGLAVGITAALGHASLRRPDNSDRFFVKGREYDFDALSIMKADDMVECDLDGFLVGGRAGLTQCSEVKIHSSIYRDHPEVQSVVHVHPRFAVLMSVLSVALRPMCQEGAQIVRRPLPVYPHMKTIQSDEEGREVAGLLGDFRAILLRGHGAITVGKSLSEAVLGMAQLEEQARMNYLAFAAAGAGYSFLTDDLISETSGRTPLSEMPHFKDVLGGRGPNRDGIWSQHLRTAEQNRE